VTKAFIGLFSLMPIKS